MFAYERSYLQVVVSTDVCLSQRHRHSDIGAVWKSTHSWCLRRPKGRDKCSNGLWTCVFRFFFFSCFLFSLFSLLLFFSIWWRVSAQFIRTSVSSATFSFSIHNSPATPPRQQKKKRTWMALVIKDFALKRTVRHQKRLDSRENVALYFGITTISFPVNARSIWSMPWEVGETW